MNKNAEEERKREEEQASRMLTASIPALLERRGGLSSREIGDELRVAARGLQNLQVVQVLLRLTEEGTLRYSRKT